MAATFGGSSGMGQTWRDDQGRVHYPDGSMGPATTAWQDQSGRTAYSAGSAGPASTAGGAYQMPSLNPPTAGDQWNSGGGTYGPALAPGQGAQQGGQPGATFGGGVNPGAVGSISSYTAGQNPYLQQLGNSLVQQNTENLQRNVLPGIASGALASGGFGGSRQGVLEANALNDLNKANANGLASLAGNAYGTALNYDVNRRGQDQSYNLGMTNANNNYDLGLRNNQLGYFNGANSYNTAQGNLGLGYAGLDRQINNDNLSWQQQGFNNNLNLWNQLQNNNQTGINAGTAMQDAPANYWNNFSQQANSIGRGYATNTSQTNNPSNPILAGLGGAQLGSQLGSWWNGGSSAGGSSSSGTGLSAPSTGFWGF